MYRYIHGHNVYIHAHNESYLAARFALHLHFRLLIEHLRREVGKEGCMVWV